MKDKNIYEITEIIELYKLDEIFIYECIEQEWIIPSDTEETHLDQEDIARMLLIKDLKNEFGVNDESIPIILHLIDQIHLLKSRISNHMKSI